MSAGGRGPTGEPPPPPDWLPTATLPVIELPAGGPLVRIHRLDRGPVFFSPGSGRLPVGRFDSPSASFGVLYLGQTFECAFAETVTSQSTTQADRLGRDCEPRRNGARSIASGPFGGAAGHGSAKAGHGQCDQHRAVRTVRRLGGGVVCSRGQAGRYRLCLPSRSKPGLRGLVFPPRHCTGNSQRADATFRHARRCCRGAAPVRQRPQLMVRNRKPRRPPYPGGISPSIRSISDAVCGLL